MTPPDSPAGTAPSRLGRYSPHRERFYSHDAGTLFLSGASIVVSRAVASLGTVVYPPTLCISRRSPSPFMPGFAFAATATTLTGQSLGAHKPYLAKRYVAHTAAAGMTILSITGTLIYFFALMLVRLFTPDAAAIAIAVDCLQGCLCPAHSGGRVGLLPARCVAQAIPAGLYITATCNWLIRASGAYVCIRVLHLGLPQAVLCTCVDFQPACLLSSLWLRYRSNRGFLPSRITIAKAS